MRVPPGVPRAGIGNTRFGAQVAAVTGEGSLRAVPVGGRGVEAAFLAPLPIGLLPADAESRERFRLFGLRRIGELAALDRSAVVARFGTVLYFLFFFLMPWYTARDKTLPVPER